jgi:hypothetical protein
MNRHDRRVAEARTRHERCEPEWEVPPGTTPRAVRPAGALPPERMLDFFKGIAWQLAGLEFGGLPEGGGHCIFHALAAYQAARAAGVDVSIGFGGMVARVGPDARRDVVAFCGPHNMGVVFPGDHAGFHCWLRYRDWIFDSSVGEWSRLDSAETERIEQEVFGQALPPTRWTVSFPNYWFKPASELELAWRPEGTPELGAAWYGPFLGDPDAIMWRVRQVHEDAGQEIANGLAKIFNAYCEQHDIPRQHGDRVYPLKFRAVSVLGV